MGPCCKQTFFFVNLSAHKYLIGNISTNRQSLILFSGRNASARSRNTKNGQLFSMAQIAEINT